MQATCKECGRERNRAWRNANPGIPAERAKAYRDARPGLAAAKAREYRAENPDKAAASDRKYREANRAKCVAKSRAWQKRNPELVAATGRAYRSANAERISKVKRSYEIENPDKIAAKQRKRRALKLGAAGSHTAADVKDIFESQRGLCATCSVKLIKSGKNRYHVDHIKPLSRGGSDDKYNLQCLCPTCNLRKNAKDPIDWAKENGKLL